MVGVVVATHGELAAELIRTAELVVGPLERVVPVSVSATVTDVRQRVAEAIARVDDGQGVLLLADLLGGSACTLCLSFLTEREVEVVTGVNLPMLLKLPGLRAAKKSAAEVAHALAEAGQKSIGHASELLRRMG